MPITGRTAQEVVLKVVDAALRGVPKDASAEEVNLRLRVQVDAPALPCSYGHYRRIVRRILEERARWCEWEGKDPKAVRSRRRASRARGTV
jgi:hypothetical protein